HRAGAEKEASADLGVREPVAGEPCDLTLLIGAPGARFGDPLPHLLARRQELTPGALGERLHADRGELVVGGSKVGAGVDPAILAAQPLAVEQVSPGELGAQSCPPQVLDRLSV